MRVKRIFVVMSSCLFATYMFWYYQQHQHARKDARVGPKKVAGTKRIVNGCIVMLATNEDLADIIDTIRQVDYRFNERYHYPYVLLNDVEFTPEFRDSVSRETRSLVEFGTIPHEQWSVPSWINRRRLEHAFNTSLKLVSSGMRMTYHHMIRFYSGFFFRHPLLLKYDYYLRLDSHLYFPCPIDEDPFATLVSKNKLYGFVMSNNEEMRSMPTLLNTIRRWLRETKHTIANEQVPEVASIFMRRTSAQAGNCQLHGFQFFNNFELASFSLFRNETYLNYFEYLDRVGGFYYERWGDAPVHTFYVLAMVELNRVHRFKDIGYGHKGIISWPSSKEVLAKCQKSIWDVPNIPLGNCNSKWDALTYVNKSLVTPS